MAMTNIHRTPLINVLIFPLALAVFGIGVAYAKDAINTPMDKQSLVCMQPRPSNGKIIVYSTFMPFFTMLQSLIDLAAHAFSTLHPIYWIVVSSIYFVGWLGQWNIWMDCEITGIGFENDSGQCFQARLNHAERSMIPSQSSAALVKGRMGLGGVLVGLYAAYLVLSILYLVLGIWTMMWVRKARKV
ncbi:MAG: hypothetical protein Q9219_004328 [cf. Caloplaca sp. 3 TL-2023]